MNKKAILTSFESILLFSTLLGILSAVPTNAQDLEPPIEIWTDYILSRDIAFSGDGFIIRADSIILDLNGHTITGSGIGTGVRLAFRSGVTVKNGMITNFHDCLIVWNSSNNTISGNYIIENNYDGILLWNSSDNTVSGNTVTGNGFAIRIGSSKSNTISGNNITRNRASGIALYEYSNNNIISENHIIQNNEFGILTDLSSNNYIHHNNFIDNGYTNAFSHLSINTWDEGYPSGGNYWSDYTTRYPGAQELDDSGIWDTPYVIARINQDNYPLMEPWSYLPGTIDELKTEIEELSLEGEIDNQGIAKSLLAKLNTTQKLAEKGKMDQAKNILEKAFIQQVQNLTDIHITREAAELLIESAEYIISHL